MGVRLSFEARSFAVFPFFQDANGLVIAVQREGLKID